MEHNPRAVRWEQSIIKVLAGFIGNIVCDDAATTLNERQQSVNDFWSCKQAILAVTCLLLCITNISAALIGRTESDTVAAMF